jgi:hypothetical protein
MPKQTSKNDSVKLRSRAAPRSGRQARAWALVVALAGASALLAAPARADTPASASAPDAINEEAKKHFATGVVFLKDPKAPRYEEAYREFKAAYAASPSPKILGNVGLCALQLEKDQEAIDAYDRYLRETVDLDAGERAQIETDLLALRAGLVRVRVTSDPPGAMIVDTRIGTKGDRVVNSYGPATQAVALGIHQGHHVLVARMPGYADTEWEFESGGGDLGSHVFQLKSTEAPPTRAPEPERPVFAHSERPVPTSVVVGGGVTVALGIASAVVGVVALNKHSRYDAANDGTDIAAANNLRDQGKTLNVVTDVLLATTIVAGAVTTFLFLNRPSVEVREQRSTSHAVLRALAEGRVRF